MKDSVSPLLDEDRAAISGPIMVELIQGARTAAEKEDLKRWVEGLIWLSVTDDIWHRAADLAFALRRKGITTGAIDTLIASLVIGHNCSLLHRDSHFTLMASHCELQSLRV